MTDPEFEVFKKENKIEFFINPKMYKLDFIYGAAYNFLDEAYLYLDGDPEQEIKVCIKSKEDIGEKELKKLAADFLNELINVGLRYRISEKNNKIREYIAGAALAGVSSELKSEIKREKSSIDEDPDDIAIPWEEKHEKKSNKKPYKKNSEGVVIPWTEE